MTVAKPPAEAASELIPPECMPNYDLLVTEDGKPVDGIYSEKQMRLLTSTLYDSWPGPGDGRPFLAHANVGVFISQYEPPIVPDVLLSLDARTGDPHTKPYRSYFVWVHGKTPDAAVEIVSNKEGDELGSKRRLYAKIGVPYYIVWDPELHLSNQRLSCFELVGRKYRRCEPWFPDIGLGVTEWRGNFEDWDNLWLRWCSEQGQVLPTAAELAEQEKARAEQENARAEQEKARAEQEKARADQEKARADKLAAQLRAAGIEPQ